MVANSRAMKPIRKTTTTRRRSSKRKHRARVSSSAIDSLPTEIMVEVLARVASSSAVDLCSCKLSCKALHEIAEEKHILQQVSLEGLPFFTWLRTGEAKSFFQRCQESNNPEALFQIGMVQYFSSLMLEQGVENLERATEQGHYGATYVLGLILLCSGDNDRVRRGVALIMNSSKSLKGGGIVECRRKLHDVMNTIWINNYMILQNRPSFSCAMQEKHAVWRGWEESNYYDEDSEEIRVVCEICRCTREVDFFYNLLPSIRV